MRLPAPLRSRSARFGLSLLVAGVVGGLLAVTIYWTEFDARWLVFLGGVLFAAMLSLVSQVSKAEWLLARRRRQVEKLRGALAEEAARSRNASAAFQLADLRLRKLGEALRSIVLFVDRDQVCRFHNPAAALLLAAKGDAIDGRPLAQLFGEATYGAMQPYVEKSLAGSACSYELLWNGARYAVRQLPVWNAAGAGHADSVCVVIVPGIRTLEEPVAAPQAATRAAALRVPAQNGEALYLRAIAHELTGWDDPKAKLTRALNEDRFLLLQQRIQPVDLAQDDAPCFEILLRLQEEEDNLLPPGGFLPEAERLGMMEDLDRWVVRNLITHCLRRGAARPGWRAPLHFVNVSAAALRSTAFAAYVQKQIEERAFDARALGFEIAEPDLIAAREEAQRFVSMLKPFGVRFGVDAFGSAKGSFAALEGIAFDFLKIDGLIVQNLRRDPVQLARARAMVTVCRKLGMRSIAEFVEDEETTALVRRVGVDYVQGFGIARPERLGAAAPQPATA